MAREIKNYLTEEALVCALLFSKEYRTNYLPVIKAEYFTRDLPKAAFDAMHMLDRQQSPIDISSVHQLLMEANFSKAFIDELLNWENKVETEDDFIVLLNHIMKLYKQRMLKSLGNKISQVDFSVDDALHETESTLEVLNGLQPILPFKPIDRIMHDFVNEMTHPAMEANFLGVHWFTELLNLQLNGLRKGELIVVGARPGMGKTSFMVTEMLHALFQQNKKVAYVSMESDRNMLLFKIISQLAKIEMPHLLSRILSDEQLQRFKEQSELLSKMPLHLLTNCDLNAYQLRHALKQIHSKSGLDLIIIDHIQLVNPGKKAKYREQEIASVVHVLKRLAQELDVPVLVSSQLSRAGQNRGITAYPMLSDLRESGSIEEAADKVMFIFRPEYYGITEMEDGSSAAGVADIQIAKNRLGPIGNVRLRFNHPYAQFEKYVEIMAPPESYIIPYTRINELDAPF